MTGKVISRFFCAVEFGEFGQGGINQTRKFIRKSVRISIKSANFRKLYRIIKKLIGNF